MNLHTIEKLDKYSAKGFLKGWYKWLKFIFFIKRGFYNGGSDTKWSRFWCWYGEHTFPTYTSTWVENGVFYLNPQCQRCGYQTQYYIKPYPHKNPKNRETILKELLLGGDYAQAVMSKVYGSEKCDCGQLWKDCKCDIL